MLPIPSPSPHAITRSGHYVIIVSSGAIGVGCQRLGLSSRPSKIAQKQALAAIGQVHLMRYYEDILNALGLVSNLYLHWGFVVQGWAARVVVAHREGSLPRMMSSHLAVCYNVCGQLHFCSCSHPCT